MSEKETSTAPVLSESRRARRYRLTGVIVLLLGLAGAGAVYWLEPRVPDYSGNADMAGFNRAEERQMEILYGKQGQLIEDLDRDLKDPGTQAILIGIGSAVIAAACFYCARILEAEAKPADATRTPQI